MRSNLVFPILLILMFIACNQRAKHLSFDLSQVEPILWENPDSALFILNTIPQSSL